MLSFTSDQWVIVALVFVLGLLVGGFLFSGGGRKWKTRYNTEIDRRRDLEKAHAEREKEWREKDSLHAAALKNRPEPVVAPREVVTERRDPVEGDRRDTITPVSNDAADRRDPTLTDRRDAIPVVDRNDDGIIDDRDR